MKIDLGCGAEKRSGYIGLDVIAFPGVDHVVNLEHDALPFEDGSVDAIFSSHCFEHVANPMNLLREMLRVARHGAQVEIWLPFGHSDEAFMIGHEIYYTELHWRHFVVDFSDAWLGTTTGGFRWKKVRYNVKEPDIHQRLRAMGMSMDFAIDHLVNVASEFGMFLEVDKTLQPADRTLPLREFSHGREGPLLE